MRIEITRAREVDTMYECGTSQFIVRFKSTEKTKHIGYREGDRSVKESFSIIALDTDGKAYHSLLFSAEDTPQLIKDLQVHLTALLHEITDQ